MQARPGHYAAAMRLTICDVGPRDGLQNEPELLSPAVRAELVSRLAAAAAPADRGCLVRARRPRAADGRRRGGRRRRRERGRRSSRGSCSTSAATSASPRRARPGQLHARRDRDLQPAERQRVARRGGRSGCARSSPRPRAGDGDDLVRVRLPVRGRGRPGAVADLCERLAGADELVLADTIGVATPRRVRRLVERVSILGRPVGAHLHNTRNTGYASAWAALEAGATCSTPRSAGSAAVRSRRTPPATSRPRISSGSSSATACRPASTWTRCSNGALARRPARPRARGPALPGRCLAARLARVRTRI